MKVIRDGKDISAPDRQNPDGWPYHIHGVRFEFPAATAEPDPAYFLFLNHEATPVPYTVALLTGFLGVLGARDGDKLTIDMVVKGATPAEDVLLARFVDELFLFGDDQTKYEIHDFSVPLKSKIIPAGVQMRLTYIPIDGTGPQVIVKGRLEGFRDPSVPLE